MKVSEWLTLILIGWNFGIGICCVHILLKINKTLKDKNDNEKR